jgi:hypothetical protein
VVVADLLVAAEAATVGAAFRAVEAIVGVVAPAAAGENAGAKA